MISENREFSKKKGVPCISAVGVCEKKSISVQTVQMNCKVLCHTSQILKLSAEVSTLTVLLNHIFIMTRIIIVTLAHADRDVCQT